MKRFALMVLMLNGLLLLAASSWAAPPLGVAASHLVGALTMVVIGLVLLVGGAAFALFWEGVMEDRIARALGTLQTRLGASAGMGFLIVLAVLALGKLSEGAPAMGGLVLVVALVGLWLLALGLVCYARWVGQRLFSESASPQLATGKGMVVVLLMGFVFPIGTFALLLLAISGLGAIILCWRGEPAAAVPAPSDSAPAE